MRYFCDEVPVDVLVEGGTGRGGPEVLADLHPGPLSGVSGFDDGFAVFPFLSPAEYGAFRAGLEALVGEAVASATGRRAQAFRLEDYHRHCPDDRSHLAVIAWLRDRADLSLFPFDAERVDARVSELLGRRVSARVAGREASGYFFLRIVRPRRPADNNPPHRDSWLERLRDAVNAYVPLAGSNERSALPMIPGSQRWPESEVERTLAGATMNGVAFTVPAAVGATRGLAMQRPRVGENEIMLFSPHVIHGGGVNLNPDITRVSLEMRFWEST